MLVYQFPFYQKNFEVLAAEYPVSQHFYERELSLSMFPILPDGEQDYVI
ncbi:MAG TPA: DegT/DnrJ/EryC1/StrS family aminotransferase [Firmicutes bacterium]|nr:DegT/DnrJ/EryC1/StrS family aminotransferase [Bacillota bacterium]